MRPGMRAGSVPANGIREIVDRARGRQGIIHLEVGEPAFPTPTHVLTAAAAALQSRSGYTDSAGMLALREAVVTKMATLHGIAAQPERVIAGHGGVQVCAAVFMALLDEGDEVLVPDPSWPNYAMQVLALGGRVVRYPLIASEGFLPDLEALSDLISSRTRVIVLNSPSNPTGAVFPAATVKRIVALAAEHSVVVLSDEVYDELIFEGAPARAVAFDSESVVGVYSLSKSYSMTGWRVGFGIAPDWLAPKLRQIQSPLLASLPGVTQYAAIAALTGPQACVAEMRGAYRSNRDLLVSGLRDGGIPVPEPSGAFYLMLPLAAGVDGRIAAFDLLEHGVAVAPGSAFGSTAQNYWRLSLAASEPELRQGLERIVAWYAETDGGANVRVAPD
jgi:aspartate aminotransferase